MVYYNTSENGKVHRGVQHGYFRVGVVDRGKISNFFQEGARTPGKSITDQNHDISGDRVQKYRCDQ